MRQFIYIFLAVMIIAIPLRGAGGVGLDSDPPIYPFVRVMEGYCLPFVEDEAQEPSIYWDITAGFSYEFMALGLSVNSHFLTSYRDSVVDPDMQLNTEGYTVAAMAHVEGKADVRPMQFAAGINLGLIWFKEYDHIRSSWTKSRTPVIGLNLDFRIPVAGKLGLNVGGGYMASFEGFEVDAKAYNSIQGTIGLAYDGAIIR